MRRSRWSVLFLVSLLLSAQGRAAKPAPVAEEPLYQGKSLAEWIDDLKDPTDATKREDAARALAVFGPKKEVVSALATVIEKYYGGGNPNPPPLPPEFLLDDVLSDAARFAAQTLGQFGPKAKEALPALRASYKRLSDPGVVYDTTARERSAPIRRAVAEALILIDDHRGPEMAPILLDALKSEDAKRRRDIVATLGKLGPDVAKTTVPALMASLKDGDAAVRLEAVKSLGLLGPAAKPAIHAVTLSLKNAAPVKRTTAANFPAFRRSELGDKAMLQACTETLGRLRPDAKGPVAALRLALGDRDVEVRWAALCALGESTRDAREVVPLEIVPVLSALVRDKDAAVRRVALKTLAQSGAEAKLLVPLLTAALEDDNALVRETAANALGDRGTAAKHAVPALIAALKDSNVEIRSAVAESLGKIGTADKEVVPALIAVLDDKEASVFEAAAAALTKYGSRAKAAIPPLVAFLQDPNPEKRSVLCLLLAGFGPAAKEAIPPLEKTALGDSEEWVRLAAHTALAKIDCSRVKGTVQVLAAALRSKEDMVRMAAVECLQELGPEARDILPALRALRERSNDEALKSGIDEALKAIQPDKNKPAER